MHEEQSLGERLKVARELLGYTQSRMSDACGSKLRSWQDYEKDDRVPGSQVIAGAAQLGINANWLLTGRGEILTNPDNWWPSGGDLTEGEFERLTKARALGRQRAPAENDANDSYAYVQRFLDVEVSAGSGAEPTDGDRIEELAFKRKWLAMQGLNPSNLRVVACRGDSMAPTIPDDSTLLVDISQNDFVREGVYVIRLDGHLFAKRLQRGQGGSIHVISDNTLYDKIIVTPEKHDFQIIGKAVWLGHTM